MQVLHTAFFQEIWNLPPIYNDAMFMAQYTQLLGSSVHTHNAMDFAPQTWMHCITTSIYHQLRCIVILTKH